MADYNVTVNQTQYTATVTQSGITVNVQPVTYTVTTGGTQGPPGPPGTSNVDLQVVDMENKQGSTVYKGQPVAIHASGSGFVLASDTIGSHAVGLAYQDTPNTTVDGVITVGILENTDWTNAVGSTNLTPGSKYYLGPTAGTLTTTPPSSANKINQLVGVAVSSSKLSLILHPIIIRR